MTVRLHRPSTTRLSRRAVVLGAASFLAGCDEVPMGYRYRLTIEIDVRGHRAIGSAVRQVTSGKVASLTSQPLTRFTTHGDAVAVKIAPNQTLYVLRDVARGGGGVWSPEPLIGHPIKTPRAIVSLPGREVRIPFNALPMMVTFTDPSDENSGRLVKPEDLAAIFGPGVTLARASVQATNAPISRGVQKGLPWLRAKMRKRCFMGVCAGTSHFEYNEFHPNISSFVG
jgi:hypothetical protein